MRILLLSWRDAEHPEAGGSETFVDRVSTGLADLGHEVTVLSSGFDGATGTRRVGNVTFRRLGGRYSLFGHVAGYLLRHGRSHDVVVDIQNGVPFWTPLWSRIPVVVVVHHVHKEQWPEVFDPARARLGWVLESRVAPVVYRRRRYVTVSEATKAELARLGVDEDRVTVVYSGNDLPEPRPEQRTDTPSLVVLGRLVPHKRVELALQALARLRTRFADLRLRVVGHGYWEPELRRTASELGVGDAVDFLGFVDDDTKHDLLASSWVHLLPSLKEGWGLVVVEAGAHGTPTVAFRGAGGTAESVLDGVSGRLADDDEGFIAAVAELLGDDELRRSMGAQARAHAVGFSWESTARQVESVLRDEAGLPVQPDAEPNYRAS